MAHGYADHVRSFVIEDEDAIVGRSVRGVQAAGGGDIVAQQDWAWRETIRLLQKQLSRVEFGHWYIVLEYEIPRRSRRPDVVLLSPTTIFVIEFKVGATVTTQLHVGKPNATPETYEIFTRDLLAAGSCLFCVRLKPPRTQSPSRPC